MRTPTSVKALEEFGRERLSKSFFMRDFLYSDISMIAQIPNIPDDPDLAIAAGSKLCTDLLEPLQDRFGRLAIRSAYRSCAVNEYGNVNKLNCASNQANYAHHIWDRRDTNGHMGASASIVIPWFADRYAAGASWTELAWWIHDHLPYSEMYFFPKLAAFNIQWHENPTRRIDSYVAPKGCLTKSGEANQSGDHSSEYDDMLSALERA